MQLNLLFSTDVLGGYGQILPLDRLEHEIAFTSQEE